MNYKINILLSIMLAFASASASAQHTETNNSIVTKMQKSPETPQKELPGQENVIADDPQGAQPWVAEGNPEEAQLSRQKLKEIELRNKDSFGGAVTLISMLIVVASLTILAALFMIFGTISSYLQKERKKKTQGINAKALQTDEADSGEVIAAIAAALAEHFSGKHDIEDTVLTIKRMKRAYSPWNSKIYNLRVFPVHNTRK